MTNSTTFGLWRGGKTQQHHPLKCHTAVLLLYPIMHRSTDCCSRMYMFRRVSGSSSSIVCYAAAVFPQGEAACVCSSSVCVRVSAHAYAQQQYVNTSIYDIRAVLLYLYHIICELYAYVISSNRVLFMCQRVFVNHRQ